MVDVPWQIIYMNNKKQRPQNRSLLNYSLKYFPHKEVILNIINTDVNFLSSVV